jgi:hypothetical protein
MNTMQIQLQQIRLQIQLNKLICYMFHEDRQLRVC